jgi:hypothetical protein
LHFIHFDIFIDPVSGQRLENVKNCRLDLRSPEIFCAQPAVIPFIFKNKATEIANFSCV